MMISYGSATFHTLGWLIFAGWRCSGLSTGRQCEHVELHAEQQPSLPGTVECAALGCRLGRERLVLGWSTQRLELGRRVRGT